MKAGPRSTGCHEGTASNAEGRDRPSVTIYAVVTSVCTCCVGTKFPVTAQSDLKPVS